MTESVRRPHFGVGVRRLHDNHEGPLIVARIRAGMAQPTAVSVALELECGAPYDVDRLVSALIRLQDRTSALPGEQQWATGSRLTT